MNNFIFHISDFPANDTIKWTNKKFDFASEHKSSFLVSLTANKISDDCLFVSGTIKGSVSLECSRCLFVYEHPIDIKIEKDMDVLSDMVDMSDELRQTITLELPMKPLCKQDCQGIPYTTANNKDFLKERWNSLLKQN
jgi:uncharacterized protein